MTSPTMPHPLGRVLHHDPRSRDYPARTAPRALGTVLHRLNAAALDQKTTSACFPPETLVRMADGSERPIEDIRLGDHVATAEGHVGRVTRMLLRDETDSLVRLMIWGHSHLRATEEHPVLTARGYIPAKDLMPGDEIALPRFRSPVVREAIVVADYVEKPSHRLPTNRRWTGVVGRKGLSTGSLAMPEKIVLDYRFGRFIGLFLAEGNCTEYTFNFTFCIDEEHSLAAEVASVMEGLGVRPNVRINQARHTCIVTGHSGGWSRLMSALCGNGCGLKELHRDLCGGSDDFLRGVLFGWLAGDGHYRRGRYEGVTVSRRLAMGMFDIAQSLGMRPVIRKEAPTKNKHAATRRHRWVVEVSSRSEDRTVVSEEEYRKSWLSHGSSGEVGVRYDKTRRSPKKWRATLPGNKTLGYFPSREDAVRAVRDERRKLAAKGGLTDHRRRNNKNRQDDRYVWRKLRHVVRQAYVGPVYDLTIEGDHSYVAEGIGVHNCTGFAAAQCINTVGYYPERRKLNKARFLGYDDAISLYSRATALDEFGWRFPPRDNGSSSLGVAKALKERGWITEYRHAFGIDHMLGALALAPCLVGTTWRTEMYYPNAAGRVSVGGHSVGGHEYLCVGANYTTEMLRFRNSWGPTYGVNGDMYISFEDFDALLKDDGDVMILVGSVP